MEDLKNAKTAEDLERWIFVQAMLAIHAGKLTCDDARAIIDNVKGILGCSAE